MSTFLEFLVAEAEEIKQHQKVTGQSRNDAAEEWIKRNAVKFRKKWNKEHQPKKIVTNQLINHIAPLTT